MNRIKRGIQGVVVLGLLVGLSLVFMNGRERARAKTTADRIRVLSSIMAAERPTSVTTDTLATLAAKYRRSDVLTDAWGRAIAVRIDDGHYVVTSFGRDGVASGCCVPAGEASPDTDLIAVDGQWRQVWN